MSQWLGIKESGYRGSCPVCGSGLPSPFYRVAATPTQSCVLLDSHAEAIAYPTGEVALALCGDCGFITNVAFQPSLVDYSVPTEESQAFSPRFRRWSDDLAADLFDRHRLRGARVLEVGCGKGDFLIQLASLGVGDALGIDPGFMERVGSTSGTSVEFIRDWFENHDEVRADVVLARHVLEHVPDVSDFTERLVSALNGDDSVLFVEVPDVGRVLSEGAFWDVYYEHCSYFTAASLQRLLESTGIADSQIRLGFEGQYLLAEGSRGRRGSATALLDQPDGAEEVAGFASAVEASISAWRQRIGSDSGRTVAVWGGGSKAVAFISAVGAESVAAVVDINPNKQDRFLPGSGVKVEPPSVLTAVSPDLVVVLNPIYEQEIGLMLDTMGIKTEVTGLGRWPEHRVRG